MPNSGRNCARAAGRHNRPDGQTNTGRVRYRGAVPPQVLPRREWKRPAARWSIIVKGDAMLRAGVGCRIGDGEGHHGGAVQRILPTPNALLIVGGALPQRRSIAGGTSSLR